ncbi:sensor histidine kinase [Solitalea lacus]|uniref:sensor histidine kinase n=1 Tax=Solitalea lacus TaxID=2911172 RepID=UPI001EDB66E4|nr:sensor histidine kinase [Solitalea lacus]UKJ06167.1 histidine kinase [Solitalea lacus]
MTLHEFIFSEKLTVRLLRHIIFWLTWGVFFLVTMGSTLMQEMINNTLGEHPIEFYCLDTLFWIITIHIPGCYAFVYFLLPKYILKKKLIGSILGIILLLSFFAFVDYLIWLPPDQKYSIFNFGKDVPNKGYTLRTVWRYGLFVPPEGSDGQLMYHLQGGLFSSLKIIGAATAITLFKRWYLKQQENERIEREKVKTELALLKTQMHPRFLFNALNTIYTYSLTATDKAANMVLKLSDVLSYMLYDCDQSQVPLKKEIHMLKDYVAVEKLRYDDRLDIHLQVNGNASSKLIAPLILLPFVENGIRNCADSSIEQPWINIIINITESELHFKLTGSNSGKSQSIDESESLLDLRKRLDSVYSQKHKFSVLAQEDAYILSLKLDLENVGDTAMGELIAENPALT